MATNVVIGSASGEIVREKSRFIAVIKEIHSEEEALQFIEEKRKQYWDARHNCFAYVIGKNNEIQRFSDDKEPSGTAGKPILDVLLGNDIHNAIIVVTRYFGGVLLGTGGLVRAYTDSSAAAVSALKGSAASAGPSDDGNTFLSTGNGSSSPGSLLPVLEGRQISFTLDYKDIGSFDNLAMRFGMCTVSKDYQETAIYTMVIEEGQLAAFTKEAMNITRGAFTLTSDDPVTYCPSGQTALMYAF